MRDRRGAFGPRRPRILTVRITDALGMPQHLTISTIIRTVLVNYIDFCGVVTPPIPNLLDRGI